MRKGGNIGMLIVLFCLILVVGMGLSYILGFWNPDTGNAEGDFVDSGLSAGYVWTADTPAAGSSPKGPETMIVTIRSKSNPCGNKLCAPVYLGTNDMTLEYPSSFGSFAGGEEVSALGTINGDKIVSEEVSLLLEMEVME